MVATLLRLSHSRALPNGLFRVLSEMATSVLKPRLWEFLSVCFYLVGLLLSPMLQKLCAKRAGTAASRALSSLSRAAPSCRRKTPAQRWSRDCARPIQRRFIFSKLGSWVLYGFYGFTLFFFYSLYCIPLKLKSFFPGTSHEKGKKKTVSKFEKFCHLN